MWHARPKRRRAACSSSHLQCAGWSEPTRAALQRLINAGAGQRLPVVFDFDNTIVSGDIGEAVLAVLARQNRVTPRTVSHALSPDFTLRGQGRVSLATCADVTEYYECLLAQTAHDKKDEAPLAAGYAWAVEAMAGLTLAEVLEATGNAFEWRDRSGADYIEVAPGKSAYPAPFFHSQIVELLAEFARHNFELWIVSASNVWSVRWMVRFALNPLLGRLGVSGALPPQRIIGISTLLSDSAGRLCKDAVLVRNSPAYAALDQKIARSLRLTACLQLPVPAYSGKVAALLDTLGREPYFCAGDSPSDLPMLGQSRHRLWLGRLDKPGYQQSLLDFARASGTDGWLFQPTRPGRNGGFVPDISQALAGSPSRFPQFAKSARLLELAEAALMKHKPRRAC